MTRTRFSKTSGHNKGDNTGSRFAGILTLPQRRALLNIITEVPKAPDHYRRNGEARATFWICKCNRRHKVRREAGGVFISRCVLCEEVYGG